MKTPRPFPRHHAVRQAPSAAKRQRGVALIIFITVIALGGIYALVSALHKASQRIAHEKATSQVLAQAKEALIGYALTYPETHPDNVPGYLPCPDQGTTEGTAESSCGNQDISAIGKLPWKTLGLPDLRDASGECLWYATSGTFKNSPNTTMMNWDTKGLLTVMASDGTTTQASSVVAVIFAPGAALSGQSRAVATPGTLCGGNYTASNYLDTAHSINNSVVSTVANAITTFISGTNDGTSFNDQLVYITAQDIFNAVQKRSDFQTNVTNLTHHVADCLANYGTQNGGIPADKRLPWAAPVGLTGSFTADTDYVDSTQAAPVLSGRVPYDVNHSKAKTANTMTGNYALKSVNCPIEPWSTQSATWYTNWYTNWKDHLFYAVADRFKPDTITTTDCAGAGCLTVNGGGQYAAVVMFAGKALSALGQDHSAKSLIANYLEGRNATNSGGSSNYQSGTASATFNDTLYCIDANLVVGSC